MTEDKKLFYMEELPDYKVASDYSDVRGWDVKDAANRTVGKVDDLLVNKAEERVVYLDVEVDKGLIEKGHQTYQASAGEGVHEFLNKDGDNHLIIPIGLATIDEEDKAVRCAEIHYDTFSKAGRHGKGAIIERAYEISVMNNYRPGSPAMVDHNNISDNFYNGKEFENRFRMGQSDDEK